VIATSGLVFGSVYSLIMIHRAYFGPSKSDTVLQGMDARELIMVLGLAALLIYSASTRNRSSTLCRHDAWRAAVARHRLHSTRFGPVRALWNSRLNTLSRLRRC
jgi:hypothetical protein